MHIKVGDTVQIIKGQDRPQTAEEAKKPSGQVIRVDTAKRRVIVEGRNKVWKHLRKSEQNPQGGRIQRDAFMPVENVMLWNPKSGKPERVHFKRSKGKRVRFFKSTNTALDE